MPVINENTPGDKDVDIYVKEGVGGQGSGYKLKSDLGKTVLGRLEDYGPEGFFGDGGNPSFESIDTYINGILNNSSSALTTEELDDLNQIRAMTGLAEMGDEHSQDENMHSTVYEDQDMIYSNYLRKNVLKNKLDALEVPQYIFTLYMLKSTKYSEFQKGQQTDSSGSDTSDDSRKDETDGKAQKSFRTLDKPNPEDIVIIAQTGSTDIGIDDVDIETFNGPANDITPLKIDFKLTEPGSITLLDRLSEAKAFCGYKSQSSTVPGLFLQLEFRGYTDAKGEGSRDEGGEIKTLEMGSGEVKKTTAYFELGGVTYDMQITPEGSVYNFSTYRQKTGAIDQLRTQTAHTIKGKNLTELFGGMGDDMIPNPVDPPKPPPGVDGISGASYQEMIHNDKYYGLTYVFTSDFRDLDEDLNNDERGPANNVRRKFELDMSHLLESSDGNVNVTTDTISDAILTDYGLLETFAKSGNMTTQPNGKGKVDWVPTGETSTTTGKVKKEIFTQTGRSITDSIQVGDASAEITIDQQKSLDGSNTYTDPVISITIPAYTHIKDCIYLILSLSDDFVNRAMKTPHVDLKKDGGRKVDKGYTRWVNLDTDHSFDYESWDEKTQTYEEHILVRPILSYTSNPNMIVFKEDYDPNPTLEAMKNRLDQLDIKKEYYYAFSGLNDQVIDINFNFDEAFTLQVPVVGFGDYSMQSAMATATFLQEDEAGANTQENNGVADDIKQKEKATGILDTLSELSDGDLGNFASYVGYTDEEVKKIISEKNASNDPDNTSQDQELLAGLAGALSVDSVGDALLGGYTKFVKTDASEVSPTESEDFIADLSDDMSIKSNYMYASALVMGLEGQDQSVANRSDYSEADAQKFVAELKPKLAVVESTNIVEEAPDERGSIRQTAMSHLMRQHMNAASHLMIDLQIRGDTDWLGNDIFYGVPKNEDKLLDFVKQSHDVLFVMEAPRRLDNDVVDEDNNTGLFDFSNINYTMSGVYRILMCKSNFSQGLFTQTLNMSYNHEYEMTKIEQLRKDEKKHSDYYNEYGTYKGNSSYGKFENWKMEPGHSPTSSGAEDSTPPGTGGGLSGNLPYGAG
jgi:hypothetical protein